MGMDWETMLHDAATYTARCAPEGALRDFTERACFAREDLWPEGQARRPREVLMELPLSPFTLCAVSRLVDLGRLAGAIWYVCTETERLDDDLRLVWDHLDSLERKYFHRR